MKMRRKDVENLIEKTMFSEKPNRSVLESAERYMETSAQKETKSKFNKKAFGWSLGSFVAAAIVLVLLMIPAMIPSNNKSPATNENQFSDSATNPPNSTNNSESPDDATEQLFGLRLNLSIVWVGTCYTVYVCEDGQATLYELNTAAEISELSDSLSVSMEGGTVEIAALNGLSADKGVFLSDGIEYSFVSFSYGEKYYVVTAKSDEMTFVLGKLYEPK